ncbi:hypothetical protein HBI79_027980 [Parastagonospora nodorum]|nr:hypothetical protein HBI79_027980 [Parastagonospora nodorum]
MQRNEPHQKGYTKRPGSLVPSLSIAIASPNRSSAVSTAWSNYTATVAIAWSNYSPTIATASPNPSYLQIVQGNSSPTVSTASPNPSCLQIVQGNSSPTVSIAWSNNSPTIATAFPNTSCVKIVEGFVSVTLSDIVAQYFNDWTTRAIFNSGRFRGDLEHISTKDQLPTSKSTSYIIRGHRGGQDRKHYGGNQEECVAEHGSDTKCLVSGRQLMVKQLNGVRFDSRRSSRCRSNQYPDIALQRHLHNTTIGASNRTPPRNGSNQSMIVTVRIRSAETRRSTRVGHKALERTSRIFQGHENVLAVLTRALEQKRLVIRFFQLRRLHIQRSSLHAVLRHAGDAVRESNCSG